MKDSEPDQSVFDAGPVSVADVLGNHGPFADSKPGFRERTEQQALATSICLLYTSPSPRDKRQSRMPSSA